MNNEIHGRNIYWVGGSKGASAKSMLTIAAIDYLQSKGEQLLLIECDTSNPDVWNAYGEEVSTETVNLDEADGWIHLVNFCDHHRDKTVIINTAARNNTAVTQYGQTLDTTLAELGRKLVALWVINRQRDSLELLKEFMAAIPNALVHVVRNGYFGGRQEVRAL